jgi:hypothetical protein
MRNCLRQIGQPHCFRSRSLEKKSRGGEGAWPLTFGRFADGLHYSSNVCCFLAKPAVSGGRGTTPEASRNRSSRPCPGGPVKNRARLLLAAGFFCGAVSADDYHEQMKRLKALDARCEQARQIQLAPIRERLIQECRTDRRRSLQDCQADFSWYGESTIGPNRNVIRGLFYDLPECQQASQAWEAWEKSQPLKR